MGSSKIQLYSLATPNGRKVGVALEEMGLAYEPHVINIMKDEQFAPDFLKVSPNNKIPAIVDPDGPGGKPISLFESGAILLYLAEKTGKFLPTEPAEKWETLQWLFWQMGGVGPMFGQFGHFFKYAKAKCTDPYPEERYATEVTRLLGVLEKQLEGRDYIVASGYTIADMATFPWVDGLTAFYNGGERVELAKFTNVNKWVERCMARPATAKGFKTCGWD